MHEKRLDRRGVLAAVGAGLGGVLAGCAEPQADSSVEGTSQTDGRGDEDRSDGRDDTDRSDERDGSVYTEVYEAVVDSVTQIHTFGTTDSNTGRESTGQGSGFRFGDSYVVTNDHVVADTAEIDLRYGTGDWSETTVVGTDFYSDLAVLEVDHVPDAATPLSLADDRPVVGQEVLAIGSPYGLAGTMTKGIISGVDRTIDAENRNDPYSNVVQTDVAVNPGNSGGPLVDLKGDVVGVVSAGGNNIGFAVSAAMVNRIVPDLIETGEYEHPYMGVSLETVNRRTAEANDLPEITGAVVTDVGNGDPADGVLESASQRSDGLRVGGDVIFAIDGEPIPDRHAVSTYIGLETSPGETIEIECWRDGREITVSLTLGARPSTA